VHRAEGLEIPKRSDYLTIVEKSQISPQGLAMANDGWGREISMSPSRLLNIFIGGASAINLTLLAVITTYMISFSGSLGEHGAKLSGIERIEQDLTALAAKVDVAANTVFERIDRLDERTGQEFQKLGVKFNELDDRLQATSLNLPDIITRLGVTDRDVIFDAAIVGSDVWAFPASLTAATQFESKGLRRESVNEALTGYRVLSIAHLTGNPIQPGIMDPSAPPKQ
jgi:hypothetical protein